MSRSRKLKSKIYEIEIESLSHEGRGISHSDNKVIFTRGALPGEKVIASRTLSRAKYEEADVVEIIKSSPDRIEAKCAVYGICGGCSFQHLSSENQIIAKLNKDNGILHDSKEKIELEYLYLIFTYLKINLK